ncbi:hypothetical protein GCM10010358_61160 [Streptomyces minutiscleroticus]|uniref:Aminoglycoside phosphotransferase n=1 Tax=Streptomyces minutiscleroticus TaxID=68238 RepID=A0A918U6E4_9ACTN|nr:hypothetical protein [Streptomyces minutiscleroticus]GGX99297.1 hypothetical protein GCM10010358_61160 [Streptomyces minutiscleroticus]
MPTPRLTDLPGTVLRLIERHSGTVTGAEAVSAGRNNAIAALVRTPERDLFVKGLPLDHPRVWTQKRETAAHPAWEDAPGEGLNALPRAQRRLWDSSSRRRPGAARAACRTGLGQPPQPA